MAHATMAAASALATGTLSSHLSRPHAASDSRLLANLIKSERTYINNLHASVMSAHAASSALSAWGTSEAPDVTECSARLADLLSASADVQSTHVSAIEGYRAALKDVSDREASIRNVVRDRDILVGRLIKASNKSASTSGKNSKKSPEERAEKVHMAQRELQACEGILAQEEAALVGVKRRTFKEALTMRMKTMGDAGAAMVDAAKEAILLLDEFDSNDYQRPQTPHYDEHGNIAQDWYSYPQHSQMQEDVSEERMAVNQQNFENSSVTPSQSASQIYQPQFAQRSSAAYSAPFRGIGENEGETQRYSKQQQQQQQQQHDEDSDSDEEDWKRSFAQESTSAHQGLPPPHQISVDAGAHRMFMPYADAPPGPAPPTKDTDRQSATGSRAPSMQSKRRSNRSENRDQFGPPTTVAMPPVPSARRLQADGVYMDPVPTAPKLYMPGASGDQADSSVGSDDAGRGGGGARYNGHNGGDGASSDGERTAKQSSRPGAKRSSSFFGKMGRLFKTDVKGESKSSSRRESPPMPHSTWNTRTDALVKDSQRMSGPMPPSSMSRKQNALNKPLVRDEPDSSEEEPIDERNVIRVTNPKRPMWQAPAKASSDVGTRNILNNELTRPASVKRTPSATITPGPASWKATQPTGGVNQSSDQQAAAPTLSRSNSVATTVKKKKKKTTKPASLAGGSEIGTDSTRIRMPANDFAKAPQRSSYVVAGDASAGVRTMEGLNFGEGVKLNKKSSKRRSAASTQNLGDQPSAGRLSAMTPSDRQSKFSTSNWVTKSNVDEVDGGEPKTSMAAIPPNPVASPASPKRHSATTATPTTPSRLKQSHTAASESVPEEDTKPKHIPQPSATMSPPLKPSLKIPGSIDLARSGSTASSNVGSAIPILPPPMSAPPPVTSMNLDDALNDSAPPQLSLTEELKRDRMSIEEDKTFDGTGRLGVADYQPNFPEEKRKERKAKPFILPKIDMPPSEPFRVDYETKDGVNRTPAREGSAGDVLTPGESRVYQTYMMQADSSPAKAQEVPAAPASGVTRFTDRIASVGRGVLGMRGSSPKSPSRAPAAAAASAAPAEDAAMATSPQSPSLPVPPPGKLSRTYSDQNIQQSSDSSEDEDLPKQMVTPATPTISIPMPSTAGVVNGIAAPARHQADTTAASSVDGGSGVGRRKSVRMAPDVKLPPESPALEAPPSRRDNKFDYSTPGSQLSSRIAPPPQAPPRISNSDTRGSIDIGAGSREVQGWSIRTAALDDSSEEDESEYMQARKQFGSVTRSWGRSTKKPSASVSEGGGGAAGATSGSIKKKKKKTASSNSGYNPAIPLPKGMEVVGRSNSVRR